jgi:hypothetical protein
MAKPQNPSKPQPESEKFKPSNVASEGPDKGRNERDMTDVARGSEPERRGASGNRGSVKS